MALPLVVILVLAIGWTAYWFIASQAADAAIDRFISQNEDRGIEISCAERNLDGFPFRFIVTCHNAHVEINRAGRMVEIDLPELRGIVQAYNPTHMIAEPTGPVIITARQPGQAARFYRTTWASLQISARLSGFAFSRGDLTATGLNIWSAPDLQNLTGAPFLAMENYEGHVRVSTLTPGKSPLPDFDFAAIAKNLTLAARGAAGRAIKIDEASVSGTAFDLPLQDIGDRAKFLRAWQQAGGRLQIDRLWIDGTDAAANIAGTLQLAASGRPQGTLAVDIVDIENLSARLNETASGSGPNFASFILQNVQNIATPSNVDGRPALRLDIEIDDGLIKIQGNPIARTEPLYPPAGS